jgi:hypothetical protein
MSARTFGWLLPVVAVLVPAVLHAATPPPPPAEDAAIRDAALAADGFPLPGAGIHLAGELVEIDPVNRRGCLRPDGLHDGFFPHFSLHAFALLPYCEVWLHGSRAELKDVPLGTHLHGRFVRPPSGEEGTVPPPREGFVRPEHSYDHAVVLEDDFSFYARRGRSWRVASIALNQGHVFLEPEGPAVPGGINERFRFDIDSVTRVWQDRRLVEAEAVEPGMTVQVNLGWAPAWQQREYGVTDIWLDEASRSFATELQNRRHLRHQRQRWVPARVDWLEPADHGGGRLGLTFFSGTDPRLLAELEAQREAGFGVAVAEKTLRTWYHRGDKKIGKVVDWKTDADPPPGSSGVHATIAFEELLEGYRPGRFVRVKADGWKFVTMPPEERLLSEADLEKSQRMVRP